ncbi:hypothetical protein ACFVTZ_02230 [Cellulosimicrobium cellulans]|uniref:hypothetical protein n=1 Tax=Cellulosimicrobium cellulans TaxID=1710 RepID=UPI0036F0139A
MLVSTASGAQHLIDTTATPPTVTRVMPVDREVDYLEVPDADGYHSGRTVFLGEQLPADDEPWALAALRADGAPAILAGTIGSVTVGEPMTMILRGLVDRGTTCRTTTAVTRIEPWLGSAPDATPSRSETGPL